MRPKPGADEITVGADCLDQEFLHFSETSHQRRSSDFRRSAGPAVTALFVTSTTMSMPCSSALWWRNDSRIVRLSSLRCHALGAARRETARPRRARSRSDRRCARRMNSASRAWHGLVRALRKSAARVRRSGRAKLNRRATRRVLDGQPGATLGAARPDNGAPGGGAHAGAETVRPFAFQNAWLIGSFRGHVRSVTQSRKGVATPTGSAKGRGKVKARPCPCQHS